MIDSLAPLVAASFQIMVIALNAGIVVAIAIAVRHLLRRYW